MQAARCLATPPVLAAGSPTHRPRHRRVRLRLRLPRLLRAGDAPRRGEEVPAGPPCPALPGEGKGPTTEPVLDKLSALISAMNDKYGADLGEADKVWVDQQWVVVKEDDEMREVALNNDRSQFEMVLEQKVKDLLIDRHDKNGVLFDLFFANPDFQVSLVRYLAGTYDEFRKESMA